MISDFLIEELREEYDLLVQKMKFRHPSYFHEYKTAMLEISPDELKTDEEYRNDFYLMAFKIELRKGMIYSFLTSEQVEEVVRRWDKLA
jgi:hypothetical protein